MHRLPTRFASDLKIHARRSLRRVLRRRRVGFISFAFSTEDAAQKARSIWQNTCFLPFPMRNSEETASEASHDQRSTSFFGWLFSQKHFHVKLLSGTAAGVIAIIFFAAFL